MNIKKSAFTFLLCLGSALGAVGIYNKFVDEPNPQTSVINSRPETPFRMVTDEMIRNGEFTPVDFTFAATVSTPAVVHVKKTFTQTGQSSNPFRDFFGDDFSPFFFGDPRLDQPRQEQAFGSGVIISEDGYIVTNDHVVSDADEIEVTLYNKRTYKAKLIGTDPSTDLALIKVDVTGLPVIPFGNSDSARIGEWVLAVGNPFDLTSTVTAGIISAKGRNINILDQNKAPIESFIQTDAAI